MKKDDGKKAMPFGGKQAPPFGKGGKKADDRAKPEPRKDHKPTERGYEKGR